MACVCGGYITVVIRYNYTILFYSFILICKTLNTIYTTIRIILLLLYTTFVENTNLKFVINPFWMFGRHDKMYIYVIKLYIQFVLYRLIKNPVTAVGKLYIYIF